jgi:uncharacterized membrane protein YfcA
VTWAQALLVFVAGIGAGTINTVVGSGTLITFPVLLGIGLSPVTANVSNTLGLVPGSVVGAYGYRSELHGQRRRLIQLGSASSVGAIIGAVLLLELPATAFKAIVPVLVGLALILVIFGPRLSRRFTSKPKLVGTSAPSDGSGPAGAVVDAEPDQAPPNVSPGLWLATMATGVYGGYFGAAQGVLLVGIMGVLINESLQRINAIKNVLAGLVNLVAAVVFIFTAHIDYTAAGLIAAGAFLGGIIGSKVGRNLSPVLLRAVIVVVGVAAIIKLVI